MGGVETNSISIDVTGNEHTTFDAYCVKMDIMQECATNGTNSTDVLNMTELQAGTNYTFYVYTIYQDVLSTNYTTVQSFTSKKSV